MKRILLLTSLVLAMLLLSACNTTPEGTGISGAYIGGNSGVVSEFQPFGVKENDAYSIFDTETFSLEVTLKNKGEYKTKPGDVSIKILGPAHEEFSGISAWELKNTADIDSISTLLTSGGEETISFATDAKYTPVVSGIVDRNLIINTEYYYETYALIPEVCLKEDLTDTRVCEVKEAKKYSVSGAPITVQSVKEDLGGSAVMALEIKLKNIAGGRVTEPNTDFDENYDWLAFSFDDSGWECKSSGKINEARLVNGEAVIICKSATLAQDTLATKSLKLTLQYKYRDLVTGKLRVKQSNS